jgi:SNF2 family DNA or RNA helicase
MLTPNDLEADQLKCIAFIDSGEDALVCADVGTGKTVIALTAALRALQYGEVKRWLVVAPKLVATDTWAQEPGLWEHLQDIKLAIACGPAEQRLKAIQSDAQIVIINYENLSWLMNRYPRPLKRKGVRPPDPLPFDGLICDEIDKLKDVSSQRFKAFRERIGVFKKRIGLTGTLIPNKLTEVWGQAYIVDGGQSFGRSFYKWQREYFYPTDFQQRKWALFPNTRQTILHALSDLAYRLPAVNLPDVVVLEPHKMRLPLSIRARYVELEKNFLLYLDDSTGKQREVEAANAAVLSGKLQQIVAGFSYVDRGKDAVWHSKARFDWYDQLYTDLGEQLLVFYHYREELDELRRRYPQLHYLGGGLSNTRARQTIKLWNEGKLTQLALHPASAGHGLNLQKSGAHNIAFLTLPWSGGMYKQVIGRLARRGQTAKRIYVHTALFSDTIDETVFGVVTGKLTGMEDFLNDLEAIGAGN